MTNINVHQQKDAIFFFKNKKANVVYAVKVVFTKAENTIHTRNGLIQKDLAQYYDVKQALSQNQTFNVTPLVRVLCALLPENVAAHALAVE